MPVALPSGSLVKPRRAVIAAAALLCLADPAEAESARETICRLIDKAAAAHDLPPGMLTRLIWKESSFRSGVTSPKGAQGIAQFMPGTAVERNLADPFDPEQAIPAAGNFIADLKVRFGSLGLAAAAYNAGPTRVANYLAGSATLPGETIRYVRFVTGYAIEDWTSGLAEASGVLAIEGADKDCLTTVAAIKASVPADSALERASLPWGVHLTGGYDKARMLITFEGMQKRYAGVIGGYQPTLLPVRVGGIRPKRYYQVRIAFADRRSATKLCNRLRSAGGDCLVTRN